MKRQAQSSKSLRNVQGQFSDSAEENNFRNLNPQQNMEQQHQGSNHLEKKQPRKRRKKNALNPQIIRQLDKAIQNQNAFIEDLGTLRDLPLFEGLSHLTLIDKYKKQRFFTIQECTKQRVKKMKRNQKIKCRWSNEDLKILVWIVCKYCQKNLILDVQNGINQKDWLEISSLIPGTDAQVCMFKWLDLMKCGGNREQKWTQWEENELKSLVQCYGQQDFTKIARMLYNRNQDERKVYRKPKHCKNHWDSFIDPKKQKGGWKVEEDVFLFKWVLNQQNIEHKGWAKLASILKNRTSNAVKNRFEYLMGKETSLQSGYGWNLTERELITTIIQKLDPQNQFQFHNFDHFRGSQSKSQNHEGILQRQSMRNEELEQVDLPINAQISLEIFQPKKLKPQSEKNQQEASHPKIKIIELNESDCWQMIRKELIGRRLIKGALYKDKISLENGQQIRL